MFEKLTQGLLRVKFGSDPLPYKFYGRCCFNFNKTVLYCRNISL